MDYIAQYWKQIKTFYRDVYQNLFAKERNTMGTIGDFQMKRGFVWDFGRMHMLLVMAIVRVPLTIAQIAFGYVAMFLICVLLITGPLWILMLFPFFTVNRWRRLRKEAKNL